MPALTERERERAKLIARFKAIKQQVAVSDVVITVSNDLEDSKENISVIENSLLAPAHECIRNIKDDKHSICNAYSSAISTSIASSRSTSPPTTVSQLPSRAKIRAVSIADAKKKLAAARMVSSSTRTSSKNKDHMINECEPSAVLNDQEVGELSESLVGCVTTEGNHKEKTSVLEAPTRRSALDKHAERRLKTNTSSEIENMEESEIQLGEQFDIANGCSKISSAKLSTLEIKATDMKCTDAGVEDATEAKSEKKAASSCDKKVCHDQSKTGDILVKEKAKQLRQRQARVKLAKVSIKHEIDPVSNELKKEQSDEHKLSLSHIKENRCHLPKKFDSSLREKAKLYRHVKIENSLSEINHHLLSESSQLNRMDNFTASIKSATTLTTDKRDDENVDIEDKSITARESIDPVEKSTYLLRPPQLGAFQEHHGHPKTKFSTSVGVVVKNENCCNLASSYSSQDGSPPSTFDNVSVNRPATLRRKENNPLPYPPTSLQSSSNPDSSLKTYSSTSDKHAENHATCSLTSFHLSTSKHTSLESSSPMSEYITLSPKKSDIRDIDSRSSGSECFDPSTHKLTSLTSGALSCSLAEQNIRKSLSKNEISVNEGALTKHTFSSLKSNENKQDKLQDGDNNALMDAFSPTSWGGGGQSSFSETSQWETAPEVLRSKRDYVVSEHDKEWGLHSEVPTVLDWENLDEVQPQSTIQKANIGWNEWSHNEWRTEWTEEASLPIEQNKADDDALVKHQSEIVRGNSKNDTEEYVNDVEEYDEFQLMEEASSIHYEGFSHSCRRESRETSPSLDHLDGIFELQMKLSEETTNADTVFEPLSMFGECERVSPEFNDENSTPTADFTENKAKKSFSWTLPKTLKSGNSKSTSSPSFVSGTTMDFSAHTTQHSNSEQPSERDMVIVDSPAGTESLESWWLSRYASTHNAAVQEAVQEALMKRPLSPIDQRSDVPTERFKTSSRFAPETARSQRVQYTEVTSKDPLSAKTMRFQRKGTRSLSEDDSIFDGLDEDSFNSLKSHSFAPSRNVERSKDVHTKGETEEDIFAGVSVSSHQVIRRNDPNANLMKSLLDGSSTIESQSLLQSAISAEERESHAPKQEEGNMPSHLTNLDDGYGVIDLSIYGRIFTAGASVTSDITTSDIFGGDLGKRLQLKQSSLNEQFDQEATFNGINNGVTINPVSASSPSTVETRHVIVKTITEEQEITKYQNDKDLYGTNVQREFSKDASRIRSLISPSSADESIRKSQPSLLKRALLMAKPGNQHASAGTADTELKCSNPAALSEPLHAGKTSILAQFSCGFRSASSFTFCSAKDDVKDFSRKEYFDAQANEIVTKSNSIDDVMIVNNKGTNESTKINTITVSRSGTPTTLQSDTKSRSRFKTMQYSNSESQSETRESFSSRDDSYSQNDQIFTSNDRTESTNDHTVYTNDTGASHDYEERRDVIERKKVAPQHERSELVSLSKLEQNKWKDWERKDSINGVDKEDDELDEQSRSMMCIQDEQSRAYEKVLLHAYNELSVRPPSKIVEKGEELNKDTGITGHPNIVSPKQAALRSETISKLLTKLANEGIEVLKLNRERKWQTRFLAITKENFWFKKCRDVRYNKVDHCPKGLLWMKKFPNNSKDHSIASMGKNGRGGIVFTEILSVSVTSDKFPLSKKQMLGKFKNSFTLVLHSHTKGTKRDVLFRCSSREDLFSLSSGIQAILDRINYDMLDVSQPLKLRQSDVPVLVNKVNSPVALAPFSSKSTMSTERYQM